MFWLSIRAIGAHTAHLRHALSQTCDGGWRLSLGHLVDSTPRFQIDIRISCNSQDHTSTESRKKITMIQKQHPKKTTIHTYVYICIHMSNTHTHIYIYIENYLQLHNTSSPFIVPELNSSFVSPSFAQRAVRDS